VLVEVLDVGQVDEPAILAIGFIGRRAVHLVMIELVLLHHSEARRPQHPAALCTARDGHNPEPWSAQWPLPRIFWAMAAFDVEKAATVIAPAAKAVLNRSRLSVEGIGILLMAICHQRNPRR
jgi:hypothetical protein